MTIRRLEQSANFSEAVVFHGLVFLSGQVAIQHADSPFDAQIEEVLSRVQALLHAAGSDRSRILSASVYLEDPGDLAALNAAWSQWLDGLGKPARTTVQASLGDPRWKVEVTVVAATSDASPP